MIYAVQSKMNVGGRGVRVQQVLNKRGLLWKTVQDEKMNGGGWRERGENQASFEYEEREGRSDLKFPIQP